jgi:uncharacterized membrane protein YhhN
MASSRTFALSWLFAALALAFILSLGHLPYPGAFLLKVSPIACLLVAVILSDPRGRKRLIIGALVFCGAGDICLELGYFTPGLAAFLVGHLFYLGAFCQHLEMSAKKSLSLIALLAYTVFIVNYLSPHLGEMQIAVYLYMAVIMAMAAAALTGRHNHPLVALGALMFVLSDSLIAINRFVEPVPAARYWIMALYYGAQYLLTWDARNTGGIARRGRDT